MAKNSLHYIGAEMDKVVNVSSVPNRSLFRYPGGKTWLIPIIRKWLAGNGPTNLIEPFCGGGIVSLTAIAEQRARTVTLVEKDPDVAAVWQTMLEAPDWLIDRIQNFQFTPENVEAIASHTPATLWEHGFQTILRNRINHGGLLIKGAGRLKAGEKGKGLASRWYPATLIRRIREIANYRSKIVFHEGDAFDFLTKSYDQPDTYFFIDPPYTLAGRKLYTYSQIDHEELFRRVAALRCHFLVTYDKSELIQSLVQKHQLKSTTIPMRTNHHVSKEEILISDDFSWLS